MSSFPGFILQVFFLILLIVVFPFVVIAKIFNAHIVVQNGSFGTLNYFVWFDNFINKFVLVERESLADDSKIETNKTIIPDLLNEFDFPFSVIKRSNLNSKVFKLK